MGTAWVVLSWGHNKGLKKPKILSGTYLRNHWIKCHMRVLSSGICTGSVILPTEHNQGPKKGTKSSKIFLQDHQTQFSFPRSSNLLRNDHTLTWVVFYRDSVFKISAGPRTLTSKIWIGLASFPSLSYINFGKIVLRSGKFQILFWRLRIMPCIGPTSFFPNAKHADTL